MNWFNNLKIRQKLFFAFGVLISMMIILTVYSASHLVAIGNTFSSLTTFTSKRHTDLNNALETLELLRINNISTAYLINDDEISQSLFVLTNSGYVDMCELYLRYLHNYREDTINDTSLTGDVLDARLNLVKEIENLFNEEFETCFYLIQNGVNRKDKSLVGEGLRESYAVSTEMTGMLNNLRELVIAHIEESTEKISSYSTKIIYTQSFVAAGIIIISIITSLFMAQIIEMPIYNLKTAATEITGGNLNYPVRSGNKDELGILANCIGDMIDSLEKANNAKSSFLANMSHEMRTPLNVIVGLTSLQLEDENLPNEVEENLKKINSAGELLLGIVNDVLDISKIEAGKLTLIQVDYNTASLLNDIVTLNMIRIEGKPINFQIEISEDLPSALYGDELRVKQIFNNLLSNAFKYTKEGTVTFSVECERAENKDIWISGTIKDTGIGIRPENIKKLFSEYNQFDTKANRKIEGTGLGLSITKRLLDMMEGEITVESEYGKGSSFQVRFKQMSADDKPLGRDIVENLRSLRYMEYKKHASATLVREDLSGSRVLVVDDYQTNLDVATGMLLKYKMKVDCVTSGVEAIDLIKRGEPVFDAVFMDHMMPEMDGIEATQLIRGLDTEYAKNVPIIALTANAIVGNDKMFLDKGFSAFLPKPINILQLDLIIKKWIRKKIPGERQVHGLKASEPEITDSKIPGVDMDAALDLYGGEMDLYMFALNSFLRNTPGSIEKLRIVSMESLPEYAITVHSLKSTSAAIGAQDVSERAKKLEAAAKGGDLPGVAAENDELLNRTEILMHDIKTWLSENQPG